MKIIKKIIVITSVLMMFLSCDTGANWYPAGKVELTSYRIDEEFGEKSCVIFYKITNSGLSRISLSTFSMEITTLSSEDNTSEYHYYSSVADKTTILPQKSVYGSFVLNFFDEGEVISSKEKIAITDAFFE